MDSKIDIIENILKIKKIYPLLSDIDVMEAINEIEFSENLSDLKIMTICVELGLSGCELQR